MSKHARGVTGAVAAIAAVLLLAAPAGASTQKAGLLAEEPLHLSGTVYTFDNQEPIAGATVRIVEVPGLEATSGPDGAYDLQVPDGTRITPYVEADGHHGIHLQTFVTAGRDIERANFQVPTEGTYNGLAALLGVQLDDQGELVNCAIVSTFSTEAVRDVTFQEFVDYGAHGVAGATATTEPPLPDPIYFNEMVIPDPSRTESSEDGGVIWTEVPTGVYRVSGHHPTERFADFVADCVPGRLVNANPPQGLYQLRDGEILDETVDAEVRKVKVVRDGKRRTVKAKLKSGEYVAASASLLRKGKEIAAIESGGGIGDYASGKRKLELRVPRKTDAGRAKLRVTFADAIANRLETTEKVRIPERRRAK